jgi:hypothetical protein
MLLLCYLFAALVFAVCKTDALMPQIAGLYTFEDCGKVLVKTVLNTRETRAQFQCQCFHIHLK